MKRYLQFLLVSFGLSFFILLGMAVARLSKGVGLFLLALLLGSSAYWICRLWRWEQAFESLHQPLLTSNDHFLKKGQEDLTFLAKYMTDLKSRFGTTRASLQRFI
ncbi:two-component sensor histidine kinase [Streptococcus dysgalactiae]|nr:two-component sensor histidine kinase [Streptococcus dysgalactiae subsp. dysgalactiae]SUN49445.1 two-component sensor histidine kinase [Streptococcus dysgalactiae]